MFKIYLSSNAQSKIFGVGNFGSESYRMKQIVEEVEKELLLLKRYVVYTNNFEKTTDEIIADSNNQEVDLHIVITSNYEKIQGVQCVPKANCMRSNGVAKEIYKNLHSIYYDKNIDYGVTYEDKNEEINKVKSPAVLVNVGSCQNVNDANWIVQNIKQIGEQIVNGIDKGMYLKLC